jgi:hypothetical protein
MIETNCYSAFPAGDKADLLFQEYRKLLLTNMLGYLRSIQSSLGLDISLLIEKYEKLDLAQKFSPAIFSLFAKLAQCSEQGEVPAIIDILHQLNILEEKEILNSEFQLSTILTEKWESDFVAKIRSEHIPNKSGEKTLVLPILSPVLAVYRKLFSNLKEQIRQIDFEFYQELDFYVTRVKLFNGKGLKAVTSAAIFGAVYMRLPPEDENLEAYFADHIIHETSHLQLDILLAFDKIVLNDEAEHFQAPMRIDPRPMIGIFHATFVLSRMVRLFQRIIKDTPKQEFINRLDTFKKKFDQGLETIEKKSILTENGQRIKDSFIQTAEI